MNTAIESKIIQVLTEVFGEDQLQGELSEVNLLRLGLDSIRMIKLVSLLESELDIEIADEAITPANFKTISAIESTVNKFMSQAA